MKKLLLVVLVVAVGIGGWRWRSAAEPAAASSKLIEDRIWIDHIPRNDKDTVQVFIALSEHSVGLFNASSQWRGAYELYRYEAHGGELRVIYPQTGKRETIRARATRCKDNDMDYCLELDGASRGVKRYYSLEGWEIDGGLAAAKLRVDSVLGQLGAAPAP